MKEIDLLEKIIKTAVKEAVQEALKSELLPIKEELKKVKMLTAKILKEGGTIQYAEPVSKPNSLLSKVANEVAGYKRYTPGASQPIRTQEVQVETYQPLSKALPAQVLAEASQHYGFDDGVGLPDVDVPIDFFINKNTQMYNSVMHDIQNNS